MSAEQMDIFNQPNPPFIKPTHISITRMRDDLKEYWARKNGSGTRGKHDVTKLDLFEASAIVEETNRNESDKMSIVEEAKFLGKLLSAIIEPYWDRKEKVQELYDSDTGQSCQTEWAGFYGEHACISAMLPISFLNRKYGNTVFDYAWRSVWDIKVHNDEAAASIQLNGLSAVEAAIADGGLGFIVVRGVAIMDHDGSFQNWHNNFKGKWSTGGLSGNSRMRKKAFAPKVIEFYRIEDIASLEAGIKNRVFKVSGQGVKLQETIGTIN